MTTNEQMTLEQVRDWHRCMQDGVAGFNSHRSMADAIDAHLTSREAKGDELSVAWQIRCPLSSDPDWKTITQKQYESTLFTGHAYGISHMTKDFELRPLFAHPAAQEAAHPTNDVVLYEYNFDFDTQHRYLLGGPVANGDQFVSIADYRSAYARGASLAKPISEFDDKAERALAELVDKIMPGLDTGDLLADSHVASRALDKPGVTDAMVRRATVAFNDYDSGPLNKGRCWDHDQMRTALNAAMAATPEAA